jgi:solute carrier family 39 (zinc transporter), member 1/2/3
MALAFALITPLGMAIWIGVLNKFNGNNPSTIVAIGTLNALSAGILVWVGVFEMWARDWVVVGGQLFDVGVGKTLVAGLGLISGIVLMGVLGK